MAAGDSGCEAYTAIAWGVGLSHERSDIAGAEGFHSLEGNMCGTATRGADALPGSKAISRAKGLHRKLGGSEALISQDRQSWIVVDFTLFSLTLLMTTMYPASPSLTTSATYLGVR